MQRLLPPLFELREPIVDRVPRVDDLLVKLSLAMIHVLTPAIFGR